MTTHNALPASAIVGVIGAGTMGAGIAHVAAAAGHKVLLFDARAGAAKDAYERTWAQLQSSAAKGRMSAEDAREIAGRITPCDALEDLVLAQLVIEAIIEDLEVKRALFANLESIVTPDAILASNTSSISITAIGAGLVRPARFAGLHFFNPAPVMRLVEVVSGLATATATIECLVATARTWGKTTVKARSTPGFIVNRVARPYYAEALRLYEERCAEPATIDAILTESTGFRMGPFALMDLIGHDVNYAVSCSVFDAYYGDPRFRPSLVQLELVQAGWLGRKSGRGFYDYGPASLNSEPEIAKVDPDVSPYEDALLAGDTIVDGMLVALTDGRTAAERARVAGRPVILRDLVLDAGSSSRIGFCASQAVSDDQISRFVATVSHAGKIATRLPDWPGLVGMRTVAMLANEAFEALLHGVADESEINLAMRFGVNYPLGPIEWARRIGLERVIQVIDAIFDITHDPRYRVSFGLRQAQEDEQ
ncbi:3-hydroxyacyl-CoA dehydrogenase [Sphingobium sp. AP50]|nr:3-hydroxyacyl-CoA dehydrogenase [Sphingobium sp. AP50]